MDTIVLSDAEFDYASERPLAEAIKAGFPIPAEDYMRDAIDFNRDMIRNPETTFYGRVSGDSMVDAGVGDGDIAVIDRSLLAHAGDIVVASVNNEFTIKILDLSHRADGYVELRPANPRYVPIRIHNTDNFEVWGVVVYTIRQWRH